jgi:methylthioribulose-1-phosphate dehydratase
MFQVWMRGMAVLVLSSIAQPTDANTLSLEKAAKEIVKTGQFLHQAKLCPATSGNISLRLDQDLFAMTVSGKHKGELTYDDIIVVNLEGMSQNTLKRPSAETLLHIVLYALFNEVGAVLHTHSLHGTVLSRLIAPSTEVITQGYELHKAFRGIATHESELRIPIFENNQDMTLLAQEITQYLKNNPAVYGFLLRGHGLYTWGRDLQEAKIRVEAFEYLFESELKSRSLCSCCYTGPA